MIIIPFIHKVKHVSPMQITMFQLLTIGGTLPWKEESSLRLIEDILHPNGIYLQGQPIQRNDMYLCPVDPIKTNLTDFYQWNELSKDNVETFCWRTVYVTGEPHNYRGWLPIPKTETLGSHSFQEIFDIIHTADIIHTTVI
jgi:hypothetical protein